MFGGVTNGWRRKDTKVNQGEENGKREKERGVEIRREKREETVDLYMYIIVCWIIKVL